jgi:hypothetical protein
MKPVPMAEAVLVWSADTGEVNVKKLRGGIPPDMDDEFNDAAGFHRLLFGAWLAVIRDGIEPAAVHRELCRVPEYVRTCPPNMPRIAALQRRALKKERRDD